MPCAARADAGEFCDYILNRGNARAEVFHKPGDYDAFLDALADATGRVPMRLLGYCLMPNHFHLEENPVGGKPGVISRFALNSGPPAGHPSG